jgi:5-formyltetrahydrofolate cyclo-ligase
LKITFISVAYEVQKHDDIEAEVHDEKPNIIITESQNYTPLP